MSVIRLDNSNFDEVVLNSDKTVLIDFWAPWCMPCRMQSPIIEKLAAETEETTVITKLNVDENNEIAAQFEVRSIPTIVVIKEGKVLYRKTGLTQKSALTKVLSSIRL